ncbi:MAG: hypothetical protein A2Y20_02025 [Firmicutes bacterium GWF2_51_9]|nr:MAG: hypothetical protein A2Y20_02025 [Firmicutes bacterium GWF2_51_9]OGS59213.1 MAG: hypothetical protein A2Y19_01070 [Firmicutes bacterium GWE2_51_13]HAM64103.1 hypothetical protein [Erysipelotrichaceae bacterium]HBZ41777.1 hypothetical protein [Erysipelotrichaceae bacterium]
MAILIVNIALIVLATAYRNQIRDHLLRHWMEKDFRTCCRITGEKHPESLMAKRWGNIRKPLPLILLASFFRDPIKAEAIFILLLVYRYESPYLKLKTSTRKLKSQIRYQFPIYLRQIQVLLQNNTVVTAIERSLVYAPSLFQEEVSHLAAQLRERPQDLDPYLDFLSFYELPEIARAMKLLYRYNTVGQADSYHQLNRMIQSTSKWLRDERISRRQSSLLAYQWWGMVPLLGVTLLFLTVMMNILMTMFGKGVSG